MYLETSFRPYRAIEAPCIRFIFLISRLKLCQREEVPPEEYPSRVTLLNNHRKQFGKNLEGYYISTCQSDHRG